MQQSTAAFESARTLGAGPWKSFWRVAMPLARPAIATGVTLALMETLADYGTMEYFGVTVFTTGIFRTWYGIGDTQGALQLAAILLLFVVALILVERYSAAGRNLSTPQRRRLDAQTAARTPRRYGLGGAGCRLSCLSSPPSVVIWSIERAEVWTQPSFWQLTFNTLWLGLMAAAITVLLALWLAYGRRRSDPATARGGQSGWVCHTIS